MTSQAATQGWFEPMISDRAMPDPDLPLRSTADEAAAAAARDVYRAEGLPSLSGAGAPVELAAGEHLHICEPDVQLHHSSASNVPGEASSGPLCITSARLVHAGARLTNVLLRNIEEMSLAEGHLLLIRMRDGSAVAIRTDSPRLLRVQLATAIAAGRGVPRP